MKCYPSAGKRRVHLFPNKTIRRRLLTNVHDDDFCHSLPLTGQLLLQSICSRFPPNIFYLLMDSLVLSPSLSSLLFIIFPPTSGNSHGERAWATFPLARWAVSSRGLMIHCLTRVTCLLSLLTLFYFFRSLL